MVKEIIFAFIFFLTSLSSSCQKDDEYQVFAIKYFGVFNMPAKEFAVGANPEDSVCVCHMFWFLNG